MTREVAAADRRGWLSSAAAPPRGGRQGRRSRRGQRGAVTAEAAVVLPVLVAFTLGLVWLIAVAVTQVRVVDAARETARVAARGETDAAATAAGRAVAPGSTRIEIRRGSDVVRVTSTAQVKGPGGLFRFLPGVDVSSRAVARVEPEVNS
jgi:Flp pilus assembly protein TadG